MKVPVLSINNKPLMPTTPSRARRMIKNNEAVPFYKIGIFCIKLTKNVRNNVQSIACGIDPGSKKEAFTLKSKSNTYLNLQTDAVYWVKDNIEARSNMRRARRFRNTPCRKPRWANRSASKRSDRVPPSTKARYDLKLNILSKLSNIYPIAGVIVEDLKASSKRGKKRWNKSFSPLQVGKKYFYREIKQMDLPLKLNSGFNTSVKRKILGLRKSTNKMEKSFDAHCVDSWVMANECVGGHNTPDNLDVHFISPIKFTRRQLNYFQYKTPKEKIKYKTKNTTILKSKTPRSAKHGCQRSLIRYGGTRSLGFKKGSIIKYIGKNGPKVKNGSKYLIGGFNNKNQLSLCSIDSLSNRLSKSIYPIDCVFVSYNKFAIR